MTNDKEVGSMATTAETIGVAPFGPDGSETEVADHTMERVREVKALINAGESEQNIARFIAGYDHFTEAERALARIVLRRHGLARSF
jgi:hypothetical protein